MSYETCCAIKTAHEMVLSSPQNGLFRPLKRVFSACDMTHIVMQNGPYCDAIQAILQNQVLFTARRGAKAA